MNVLLVQTGFLGDVVLSTPVIANLRNQYPQAKISVLTTPLAAPLLESHPDVHEVIIFDKRKKDSGVRGLIRMGALLRERAFTFAFSLHKSYRTALLLCLARIPTRYGFKEASASFLYTKTVPRSDLAHDVLRNLAILRAIGIAPEDAEQQMCVHLSEKAKASAEAVLAPYSGSRLVGIAPGSVWATKRWTIDGFAETAKELQQRGYHVILLGGPDDGDTGKAIEQASGVQVQNLIGTLSLLESAAVIDSLDLLISNDSAPLHLASARSTPVLAIFCATVPEFGYGPWGVPHEIVEVENLSCRPCGRHGGNSCPTGTHACQKQISSNMVLAAAERLLANPVQGELG